MNRILRLRSAAPPRQSVSVLHAPISQLVSSPSPPPLPASPRSPSLDGLLCPIRGSTGARVAVDTHAILTACEWNDCGPQCLLNLRTPVHVPWGANLPRIFPFRLAPSLVALVQARWDGRDGLYVFQQNGQPIGVGALRSAWKRATKRAGLDGRRLHDLRRTRARELRRKLAESDIMELCGWETREMFKRYAIKDERHLEEAVGKAFGTPSARPKPSGAPADSGH